MWIIWGALALIGFYIWGESEGRLVVAPEEKAPKGGRVTRWAALIKAECARQKGPVKPSQVLATVEHESGGNPRAMSYYRKKGVPYNDPPMPKRLTPQQKRAFMVANWSGHAYGLGQLIPETGAMYGGIIGAGYTRAPGGQPGDSYNPQKNIKGTVALLNALMRQYHGNKRAVYAAYYAGSGSVQKYGIEHFKTYIEASLARESKYHAFD